jgi:hypothetical protein
MLLLQREEPVQPTQPVVEEMQPVEAKSTTEPPKEQSARVVNSDEEESYKNVGKRLEPIAPEPLSSPVSPPMASPPSYDDASNPAQSAAQPVAKVAAVETSKVAPKEEAPKVKPSPPATVVPPADTSNIYQAEAKRYAGENKDLRNNLQTANENILSMQKTIDSLKRELSTAQATVATLRKNESPSTTSVTSSGRKLASTVKPEDAVHQHLASLQVASPAEGYPPQVVAIIAFVVFLFTWLFF